MMRVLPKAFFTSERTEMSLFKYEFLKQRWIKNNPNSTPQEYQKAMKDIARKCGV